MNFTTKDGDNDPWKGGNYAIDHFGYDTPTRGWWYNHCHLTQPNTLYNHNEAIYLNCKYHPLPFIEIKIRPHNCNI